MQIQYLGQSSFIIKTKTSTTLIDPYENKVGKKFPKINALDIMLITHDHFDHNNKAAYDGEYFLINTPGEYDVKNVSVKGIFSYHDNKKGAERGANTIYKIEVEHVNLCHLGDLGEKLTEDQIEEIGNIDILFIPVGGKYTIDAAEAVKIISQIEPKIVIPMHYGKSYNKELGLDSLDLFLKEMGISEPEKVSTLKVDSTSFTDDSEGTKVIIIEE